MKFFTILPALVALAAFHGYLGIFDPTARRFIGVLCLLAIPLVRKERHWPSLAAAAVAMALVLHTGKILFLVPFILACFRQKQLSLAWFAFDVLELFRLETGFARVWNDAPAWTSHGPTPLDLGVALYAVILVIVGCRLSRARILTAALAIAGISVALYLRPFFIPVAAFGLSFYLRDEEEELPKPHWTALAAAVGVLLMVFTPLGTPRKGEILICKPGLFNLEKPKQGVFMKDVSGPVVACLFDVLGSFGFESRTVEGEITPSLSTQIVVLINPTRKFSAAEIDRLYEFMSKGGSVLVLGEHTNVDGVRDHLNPLTSRAGIELNDDTTWAWNDGFCVDWVRHPALRRIKSEDDLQVGVGCSLTLSAPARPLLIGRATYGDAGDPSNAEYAFLGNRKRDEGERQGDLVLAAEAPVGSGKLIVFGDSLTFQDAYVPRTWMFIVSLFEYLSRTDTAPRHVWKILGLIVLAALFRRKFVWGASAVAWIALAAHDHLAPSLPIPEFKPSMPVAWIDLSHRPLSLRPMSDAPESADGLVFNLYRNGFLPLYLGRFDDPRLFESKLLIVPASARSWSSSEMETLDRYLNGRTVIASVGFPDRFSADPLLSHFGMSLGGKPLGSGGRDCAARFFSCWPIRGNVEPIAVAYDSPVVARKGSFILIADSHFLSMKNLEGYSSVVEENVAFLRPLLEEAKRK